MKFLSSFQCIYCRRHFSDFDVFQKHKHGHSHKLYSTSWTPYRRHKCKTKPSVLTNYVKKYKNKKLVLSHLDAASEEDFGMFEHICTYCNISFSAKSLLVAHVTSQHKNSTLKNVPIQSGPFLSETPGHTHGCTDCKLHFFTREVLLDHIDSEHTYKCVHCGIHLVGKNMHIVSEHKHKCTHCGRRFVSRKWLSVHMCTICGIYFKHRKRLSAHMDFKHSHICGHCGVYFLTTEFLLVHIDSEHNHKCVHCGVFFVTKENLFDHIDSEHIQRCTHCRSFFISNELLSAHILSKHTHKCFFCGIDFATKKLLSAHINSEHTHRCTHCKKLLVDKIRHYRTVPECRNCQQKFARQEAPAAPQYRCELCGKLFIAQCQQNWHRVNIHHKNLTNYACMNCQKIVTGERDLINHEMLTLHCAYCKECFTSNQDLMSHWERRQQITKWGSKAFQKGTK